ncbi:unnamed protein product [Cuscuta epithymum]|uniref:DUF3741 domain-containing protein n=1 Tax=Cuscuta epithymum TaxID=186058 RepID=A0AAV0EDH7_9ASTE|nr:unnamed protein product [Cuscuta epithymum]
MNESGGISASSLAITTTEKKPQRSGGGCVALFFQLFDWNRRLAKKRFFPKKLLPPDRSNQGSKKFGGDEKQPKLRLIADENSGGFPNFGKSSKFYYSEKKKEMRSPGLVARLMGLDSMPALPRDDYPKKVSLKDQSSATSSKEENKFEEGGDPIVANLRPQKAQKTGMSDRLPVTRFGSEAFHIKSMLSRPRKKHLHHPKLVSPVKSSRNVPRSRLIGVANKILDPGGMQKKGRGKYVLTASDTLHPPSSCRNCGHSFDIVDSIPNEEHEVSGIPSETNVPKVPLYFSHEQIERRPYPQTSSIGLMHKAQRQNQIFPGRYTRVKQNQTGPTSEAKDFVSLNKSLKRMPVKAERFDFEAERNFSNGRAKSVSPVRKRRSMNVARQGESPGHTYASSNPMSGKDTDLNGTLRLNGSNNAPFTFTSRFNPKTVLPRKSTTVLLQELISALTVDRQFEEDRFNVRPSKISGIFSPAAPTKFMDTSFTSKSFVTDLTNNVTEVLEKTKLFYGYLRKGSKLNYAKEVILNAELVVSNFSITRFVLEDLETLSCVITMRFSDILGIHTTRNENVLKRFVFDCLLEFLDSKCVFKACAKLPPFTNVETLVFEILEEVKLWMGMKGWAHDELLDWDMSHSLGEWTGFGIDKAFECGAEIGQLILHSLVEEVVNYL